MPKQKTKTIITVDGEEKTLCCGKWSVEEHNRFLEGLKLYGTKWVHVTRHLQTRDILNVRSHAQKYLRKLLIGRRKTCTNVDREYFKHILTVKKVARIKVHSHIDKLKAITKDPNLTEHISKFKIIFNIENTNK